MTTIAPVPESDPKPPTRRRKLASEDTSAKTSGRPDIAITIPQFKVSVDGETPDDYAEAPGLAKLAMWMIDTFPELSHLQGKPIAYLWKREGGKQAGIPRMGAGGVCNGEQRYTLRTLYRVWIAADHAAAAEYGPDEYERELYHQLLHFGVKVDDRTDEETVTVRPHDIECFAEELSRYGAWRSDILTAQTILMQTKLDLGEQTNPVAFRARR